MTSDDQRPPDTDAEIEREIRQSRKLTARDLMAHIAGPGSMKGGSPISQIQQAENEIGVWLANNLPDDDGALRVVLLRQLRGSERLLESLDRPLEALAEYGRRVLATDTLLNELVGEADIEWARAMDERPFFERAGAPAHPDDPYTIEGVRRSLVEALAKLPDPIG